MKKWMMAALAALAFVGNTQAGLIMWDFQDCYPPFGNGIFEIYVFALGDSRYDFGDGSFNFDTLKLTPLVNGLLEGEPFEGGTQPPTILDFTSGGGGGTIEYETPASEKFNQWWAVIVVASDPTDPLLGWFGYDVFEISGMWEDVGEWHRTLWAGDEYAYGDDWGDDYYWEWRERIDWQFDPRKYGPIPEPATGLLMLSGAAMLLLRRKRT